MYAFLFGSNVFPSCFTGKSNLTLSTMIKPIVGNCDRYIDTACNKASTFRFEPNPAVGQSPSILLLYIEANMLSWWSNLTREQQKVLFSLLTLLIYLGVCVLFYYYYENWSPSESLFFAVVTMTTVGKTFSRRC